MLCRELNDKSMIRLRESIYPDDHRAGTLPDCGIECPSEIARLSYVEKLGLDSQGCRGDLCLFPLKRVIRIAHIQESTRFVRRSEPPL